MMSKKNKLNINGKYGLVYRPANRFIEQYGVSIYTPVRRFQLSKYKKIDKIFEFFLGPAENVLETPRLIYYSANNHGNYDLEKVPVYYYGLKYNGFGLVVRKVNQGFAVVDVLRGSPADESGVITGLVFKELKVNNKKKSLEDVSIRQIRDLLFSNNKITLISAEGKELLLEAREVSF